MYRTNKQKSSKSINVIIEIEKGDDGINPVENFNGKHEKQQENFKPEEIKFSIKQPTIYNIVQRIAATPQEIDMNTSFQRSSDLWNRTLQSHLIESVMLRIPLPAFYFDGSDDEKWLIIDGLQRLSAFEAYIIKEEFGLKNLEYLKEFEGLKFSELPKNMIRRIEETQIIANVILRGTPDEVKFNIFKRINTGGFNLNSQEIRHAIYHGKVANFIEKLATLNEFKQYNISSRRMLDQELITRFVAFRIQKVEDYVETMDNFLIKAMDLLKSYQKDQLLELERGFSSSMNRAHALFNDMAFRKLNSDVGQKKKYPINKPLFEVWSVCLSEITENDFVSLIKSKIFKKEYRKLFHDEEFINAITVGTGHKKAVLYRFQKIKELIQGCI